MTRRFSLITAVVGAALVVAVPALGQRADDQGTVGPTAARTDPVRDDYFLTPTPDPVRDDYFRTVTPDPVRDDYFRIDSSSITAPSATAGSSRDIEWPQIGIGFAGGVLLALGLLLALRMPRVRQPAH